MSSILEPPSDGKPDPQDFLDLDQLVELESQHPDHPCFGRFCLVCSERQAIAKRAPYGDSLP